MRNFAIVGIFVLILSACDSDPDCGEYAAAQSVSKILTENQPNKLTDYVINNSAQFTQPISDNNPQLSLSITYGASCRILILLPIPEPGSQMYDEIKQSAMGIDKYMASRKFCSSLYVQIAAALKTTVYSLSKTRTLAVNHDTKSVSCVADVDLHIPEWGSATLPNLRFSVERTSQGEKVVTVFGLK